MSVREAEGGGRLFFPAAQCQKFNHVALLAAIAADARPRSQPAVLCAALQAPARHAAINRARAVYPH